jgi:hypothetical protein
MLRSVAAKAAWVGRSASMVFGLALVLALVVGVGTMALAAVPGDPFRLGQTNTINNAFTRLVGSNAGDAMLKVDNDSSAASSRALDLRVEAGKAPLNVNSDAGKATNLDADKLDGLSADDFISEDKIYTVVEGEVGSGGGAEVTVFADCDSGDRVLGGGGGGAFAPDILRLSDPNGQGWRVFAQDNAAGSNINAKAICADFPPLRP